MYYDTTKALKAGEDIFKVVAKTHILDDNEVESMELSVKKTKKKWVTSDKKGVLSIRAFMYMHNLARQRQIKLSNQDMFVFFLLCDNIQKDTDRVVLPREELIQASTLTKANFNTSIRRLLKINLISIDKFKSFHVNADLLAYGYMNTLHKQGLMTK